MQVRPSSQGEQELPHSRGDDHFVLGLHGEPGSPLPCNDGQGPVGLAQFPDFETGSTHRLPVRPRLIFAYRGRIYNICFFCSMAGSIRSSELRPGKDTSGNQKPVDEHGMAEAYKG